VLDYIGDNLAADLSLSQLSTVAGMSPHYFTELFRQSTGSAPHRYVLAQKIEHAKQRLRDPKMNIIDAGVAAGFDNPSHFARIVSEARRDHTLEVQSREHFLSRTCLSAPHSTTS
jgi:AraC family transcriptional regulator